MARRIGCKFCTASSVGLSMRCIACLQLYLSQPNGPFLGLVFRVTTSGSKQDRIVKYLAPYMKLFPAFAMQKIYDPKP